MRDPMRHSDADSVRASDLRIRSQQQKQRQATARQAQLCVDVSSEQGLTRERAHVPDSISALAASSEFDRTASSDLAAAASFCRVDNSVQRCFSRSFFCSSSAPLSAKDFSRNCSTPRSRMTSSMASRFLEVRARCSLLAIWITKQQRGAVTGRSRRRFS